MTYLSPRTAILAPLILGVYARFPTAGMPLLGFLGQNVQEAHVYIPEVFAGLEIGLVVACAPDSLTKPGICFPVLPLSQPPELPVDTSCSDSDCMLSLLEDFAAATDKPILITWDECRRNSLAGDIHLEEIDGRDPRFYVTTVIHNGELLGQISEDCQSGTAVFEDQRGIPLDSHLLRKRSPEIITVHKLKSLLREKDHGRQH